MINILTSTFLAHHKHQRPLRDDLNVSVFRTCTSGLGAGRRPRFASWTVHLTGSDGEDWQRTKAKRNAIHRWNARQEFLMARNSHATSADCMKSASSSRACLHAQLTAQDTASVGAGACPCPPVRGCGASLAPVVEAAAGDPPPRLLDAPQRQPLGRSEITAATSSRQSRSSAGMGESS